MPSLLIFFHFTHIFIYVKMIFFQKASCPMRSTSPYTRGESKTKIFKIKKNSFPDNSTSNPPLVYILKNQKFHPQTSFCTLLIPNYHNIPLNLNSLLRFSDSISNSVPSFTIFVPCFFVPLPLICRFP